MELGETDQYPLLEIGKIMEIVVHTFHRFDGIVNTVNTLDHASRESMSEVIRYQKLSIVTPIFKRYILRNGCAMIPTSLQTISFIT